MRKKKEDEKIERERKLDGLVKELENFHWKLSKVVTLYHNDVLRSLDRFADSGEKEFRINDKVLDENEFLLTLRKIIHFKAPLVGLDIQSIIPSNRIVRLKRSIDAMLDHLSSLPGSRKHEIPDIFRKIKIGYLISTND